MAFDSHANDYEAPIVNGRAIPSARASALLLESHTVASRALLLGDGGMGRAELPLITGGSVSCDSTATVRRSATLSVLADWDSLTPYGPRVCVQRGVRVAVDAVEWITLMTGPIWETDQDATTPGEDAMAIPLKDEMAMIARDQFDAATSTDPALTAIAQITAWILRTLPAATIVDLSGDRGQMLAGKLDVQKDPAAGITKIAAAVGCELYCGRGYQEFVLAPVPTLDDPPRWPLEVGGPRANIATVSRKRTLSGVYNRVLVTGATTDATVGGTSTPPPAGTATISDPSDPLRYGGPAGRATKTISMPSVRSNDQAALAAQGWIEKLRGGNLDVSFTALVNPALDGGDVIASRLADRRSRVHITDAVSLPLGHGDLQSISTRGLELPDDVGAA